MKCATFTGGGAHRAAAKIGATLAAFLVFAACGRTQAVQLGKEPSLQATMDLHVGAARTAEYVPHLLGERVAVVTNQTGLIGKRHLVDSLLALNVQVVKVFAPEHGFRGEADAGEHVKNGKDASTGLSLVSLYGSNKKPTPEQMADVDVLLFDIQDVGVRFYTYIGTLHYVMEAAAENGKKVVVLDRPNPNGFYVDGPILDMKFSSFVGMHPVPLVHGMTVGEFARMINGEGWLKGGKTCELVVIPCIGYSHDMFYELPVRPSPNLPNASAVYLYPSLGLFEGTVVSVGRGTDKPCQCIGYPGNPVGRYTFTPHSMPGAKDPPHKDKPCTGLDLQEYGTFQSRLDKRIDLQWLIGLYAEAPDKAKFFTSFFDKLAGGPALREQVIAGKSEEAIRTSWSEGLQRFAPVRAKYLLYP
ncbi:MAG: DUF1343 domain-containing protein [Flavobacteriales bacterium]|nr:DUF1343 domain-containing protein [Flavobacteriales bacterium]